MENLIHVITGAAACGKTTLAMEIIANRSYYEIPNYHQTFYNFKDIPEVFLIDGLNDISELKEFITTDQISINRKMREVITIKRPELIVISNILSKNDFPNLPHFKFYELS